MTILSAPSILYHYTTAAGLMGILKTRQIWATHARYVNDATELEHAFDLIRGVLASYPANDVFARASRRLAAPKPAFFMACFCEADDLLSQWRAYAGRGRVTGYSLGFETGLLPSDHLVQVLYEPAAQEAEVRSVIEESLRESDYTEEFRALALNAALLRLSVRLKHPAFEEEREWRLVYNLEDEHSGFDLTSLRANFRPSDQFVTPYMEVDLPTKMGRWDKEILHLRSVRCGPSANPSEACYSLRWMLWSYGYSEPETTICRSRAPLRLGHNA